MGHKPDEAMTLPDVVSSTDVLLRALPRSPALKTLYTTVFRVPTYPTQRLTANINAIRPRSAMVTRDAERMQRILRPGTLKQPNIIKWIPCNDRPIKPWAIPAGPTQNHRPS